MAARSCRRRTRTARGRSWRWRCAPATTSRTSARRARFNMTKINRRSMLGLLGSVPLAAGFTWTAAEAAEAAQAAQTARRAAAGEKPTPFTATFFTPHEYATTVGLVELLLPKDERPVRPT